MSSSSSDSADEDNNDNDDNVNVNVNDNMIPATSSSSSSSNKDNTVLIPSPKDILMGRGAPVSEHAGNAKLRQLVLERYTDYLQASARAQKHAVATDIIRAVQQGGGRFLRKVEQDDSHHDDNNKDNNDNATSLAAWQAVNDPKQIVNKVKQLLRDMAPQARQRRADRKQKRQRSDEEKTNPTSATATPTASGSKRKRGRPRKYDSNKSNNNNNSNNNSNSDRDQNPDNDKAGDGYDNDSSRRLQLLDNSPPSGMGDMAHTNTTTATTPQLLQQQQQQQQQLWQLQQLQHQQVQLLQQLQQASQQAMGAASTKMNHAASSAFSPPLQQQQPQQQQQMMMRMMMMGGGGGGAAPNSNNPMMMNMAANAGTTNQNPFLFMRDGNNNNNNNNNIGNNMMLSMGGGSARVDTLLGGNFANMIGSSGATIRSKLPNMPGTINQMSQNDKSKDECSANDADEKKEGQEDTIKESDEAGNQTKDSVSSPRQKQKQQEQHASSVQQLLLYPQLSYDPSLQQQLSQNLSLQQQLSRNLSLQQQLSRNPSLQQHLAQNPSLQQQLAQNHLLQQQLSQQNQTMNSPKNLSVMTQQRHHHQNGFPNLLNPNNLANIQDAQAFNPLLGAMNNGNINNNSNNLPMSTGVAGDGLHSLQDMAKLQQTTRSFNAFNSTSSTVPSNSASGLSSNDLSLALLQQRLLANHPSSNDITDHSSAFDPTPIAEPKQDGDTTSTEMQARLAQLQQGIGGLSSSFGVPGGLPTSATGMSGLAPSVGLASEALSNQLLSPVPTNAGNSSDTNTLARLQQLQQRLNDNRDHDSASGPSDMTGGTSEAEKLARLKQLQDELNSSRRKRLQLEASLSFDNGGSATDTSNNAALKQLNSSNNGGSQATLFDASRANNSNALSRLQQLQQGMTSNNSYNPLSFADTETNDYNALRRLQQAREGINSGNDAVSSLGGNSFDLNSLRGFEQNRLGIDGFLDTSNSKASTGNANQGPLACLEPLQQQTNRSSQFPSSSGTTDVLGQQQRSGSSDNAVADLGVVARLQRLRGEITSNQSGFLGGNIVEQQRRSSMASSTSGDQGSEASILARLERLRQEAAILSSRRDQGRAIVDPPTTNNEHSFDLGGNSLGALSQLGRQQVMEGALTGNKTGNNDSQLSALSLTNQRSNSPGNLGALDRLHQFQGTTNSSRQLVANKSPLQSGLSVDLAMSNPASIDRLHQLQAIKRNSLLGSLGGSLHQQQAHNTTNSLGNPRMSDLDSLTRLQQLQQQSISGLGTNSYQHSSGYGHLNDATALNRLNHFGGMAQLRKDLSQENGQSNTNESDGMARFQQQLFNAGTRSDASSLVKQLAQNNRLSTEANNPSVSERSPVGATSNANLPGGTQLNPANQMMLLQQLGVDPTPRRESLSSPPESTTRHAASGAPLGATSQGQVISQLGHQQEQPSNMNILLQQYLARSSNPGATSNSDT